MIHFHQSIKQAAQRKGHLEVKEDKYRIIYGFF